MIVSFYTSISGIVKAELFPSTCARWASASPMRSPTRMFGGTAEYVALWLKSVGHESLFFWYVTAMCAIALVASILMPDTRERGYLDGTGEVETEPLLKAA